MSHAQFAAVLMAAPFLTLCLIWLCAHATHAIAQRRAVRARIERIKRRPF